MRAAFSLLFVLTALPAFASSVTVSCDPPGETIGGTVSAQCSGQGDEGRTASASASFALNIASDPANFSILSTVQVTSAAIAGYQVPLSTSSLATTQINWDDYLLTADPVRAGYLKIQSIQTPTVGTDGAGGFVNFGFSTAGNGITTGFIGCDNFGGCVPGNGGINAEDPLIPITLGVPLELISQGAASANAERIVDDIQAVAIMIESYEFRFLEADGVTPVAVSEAPEPATVLLVGAVLTAAFLLKRSNVHRGPRVVRSFAEPSRPVRNGPVVAIGDGFCIDQFASDADSG